MYRKIILPGLFLSMSLSCACNKLVTVDLPVNQISTGSVFSNDKSAIAALENIYTVLDGGLAPYYNANISMYGGELIYSGYVEEARQFYNGRLTTENTLNLNIWKNFYSIIYQSNVILENIQESSVSGDVKTQITGECYFLRAFAYFYLTNLYGDIPLLTTSLVSQTANSTKVSCKEIYTLVNSDLHKAISMLKEEYPSAERCRANKWAALALSAKVQLYEDEYGGAQEACTQIIESSLYKMEVLGQVYQKGSRETILQFWTRNGFTQMGINFIPTANTINYIISPFLLSAFEPNDQRKDNWITSSDTIYYPFKYQKNVTTSGNVSEYFIGFRLAEQYLIRAECRAKTDQLPGANQDLNVVRERAGLPAVALNSSSALLAAIARERRTELFCDWGDRFFDLKRTKQLEAVMTLEKPQWAPAGVVLPIPAYEILNNPNLVQNTGY